MSTPEGDLARMQMTNGKYRVLLLDTKFRNPNHYICLALRDALKRSSDVEFVVKADPLDAIHLSYTHGCNLFIAFDGEELDQTLCKRLAHACGRSILWVTEDPYEVSVNKRNAEIFDLVFTNDSSSVVEYGQRGRHLPLAGAVEFHDIPVLPVDKPFRYELFFAGTAWPNRTAFVRSILTEIPGTWRFKLALPVNEHLPPRNIALPESQISWRTSPPDFGRFVNRSAVTILLPRVFSASGDRQFAETPPPRLFEAALAGGVQLVQEGLSEAALAFEPEREILLFSDGRDFIQKVAAVVGDREYRNRIAMAARERALRDHTYDRRVETMLGEMRKWSALASQAIAVQGSGSSSKSRKSVLFVCHNYVERGHFGGVEIYLDRLRATLGEEFNLLFYVPGGPGEHHESLLLSQNYEVLKRYRFSDTWDKTMLSSPERESAFHSLLVENQVDFVHFHHFIGHVPSLVYIAKSLGIPTAITAHDYMAVCNEFQLISFRGSFCGAPNVSLSQCDLCLWKKHEIIPGSQAARRGFWGAVLAAADLLIFNTVGVRELVSAVYPGVRQHPGVRVLPVPILDNKFASLPAGLSRNGRKQETPILKVALLGNVTVGKGGDLFAPTASALAKAPVEFHVFGRVDEEYAYLKDTRSFPNVIVHGPYLADQPPSDLLQCDVSVHASIWPETYCLTLSEAWQIGIVPIVADIGALGERVTDRVNGLKIRAGEEGDLINAIRLLAEDRNLLEKLRTNISSDLYETLTPHVSALAGEYRKLCRDLPRGVVNEVRRITGVAELGIVLQSPLWVQDGVAPRMPVRRANVVMPRSKLWRLHAFYQHHGFKSTATLIARHAQRIIWKR